MDNIIVKLSKDRHHVLFFRKHANLRNEDSHFYYVPTRELQSEEGVREWLRHLSTKGWFINEVAVDFKREAGIK